MRWQIVQEWLVSNWFGVLATIAGLASSYMFFVRGKRDRRPCYYCSSDYIIESAHELIPGLRLHFDGHGADLFDFSISKLVIWNSGRETIRKEDVASADPLRVLIKEGRSILAAKIVYQSNSANLFKCSVNREKTVATVSFDYLDFEQVVVVEVAHTGTEDDHLTLTGTIKGAPGGGKIQRIKGHHLPMRRTRSRRILRWSQGVASTFFSIALTIWVYGQYTHKDRINDFRTEANLNRIKVLNEVFDVPNKEPFLTTETRQQLLTKLDALDENPDPLLKTEMLVAVTLSCSLMWIQAIWLGRRRVPLEADRFL